MQTRNFHPLFASQMNMQACSLETWYQIMTIVSFNQIIELNDLLKKKNIPFKIHIRDACGGQSFYIESMEALDDKGKNEVLYETLQQYFAKNRMTIIYAEDKINFTIK